MTNPKRKSSFILTSSFLPCTRAMLMGPSPAPSEGKDEEESDHLQCQKDHRQHPSGSGSSLASSSSPSLKHGSWKMDGRQDDDPGKRQKLLLTSSSFSSFSKDRTTSVHVCIIVFLLLVNCISGNINGVRGEMGDRRVKRSPEAHLLSYAPQQTDASAHDQQINDKDPGREAVNDGSEVRRSPSPRSSSLPKADRYTSDKLISSRDQNDDDREGGKAMELVPHNLSIVLVKWYPQPSIRVSWSFESSSKVSCEAFQVMYHSMNSKFRYIIEVPCHIRNVTIERLLPATEYVLTVNVIPSPADHQPHHHQHNQAVRLPVTPNGMTSVPMTSSSSPSAPSSHTSSTSKFTTTETQQSIASPSGPNVIRFVSPQVEYTRANKWKSLVIRSDGPSAGVAGSEGEIVKSGELAVVIFVLSGWIFMIVIFVKKWGRIRGIETVSTYSNVTGSAAVVAASAFTSQVSPTSAAAGTMFAYPPLGSTAVTMGSTAGSILRSQKSKESDESSGSHGDRGNMHATASVRKKRLEDAIHQFMLMKNQQSIGQIRSGYGIYDQILIGRKGIRSMEGHRTSRRHRRRGSLEDRCKMRSEGDLNQDVRMNRSAENLLRLDFA